MSHKRIRAGVALWLLLSATAVSAQTVPDRNGVIGVVAGLDPAFSPFNTSAKTSGRFGTDRIIENSFHDVYHPAFEISVEIGRAFGAAQLGGRVRFARASARDAVPFIQETALSGVVRDPLFVSFDDYASVTVEFAGVREIRTSSRATPYVGGSAGIAIVRKIDLHGFCIDAVPSCGFYQRSTVPVFGAIVGVSFPIAPVTSLAVESGLRYQANLRKDPSTLGLGFIDGIYTGGRWSIPITTTLRFRF